MENKRNHGRSTTKRQTLWEGKVLWGGGGTFWSEYKKVQVELSKPCNLFIVPGRCNPHII